VVMLAGLTKLFNAFPGYRVWKLYARGVL
jgi:hypothetical protein